MAIIRLACLLTALATGLVSAHAGEVIGWGAAQTPVPSMGDVRQVSSGLGHSLALRRDGTVAAWGYNFNGQCNVPSGLSSIRSVAAGEFFSFAVRSNGTVTAWGDNMYGQCEVPAGLANVTSVSGGHGHSVALRADGSVVAWGNNDYGQTNVPPGLGNVVAVRAAGNYTMALKSSGSVAAWGDNSFRQTSVPAGLSGVTAIDGSIAYCLARKSDGTVILWGQGPQVPGELSQVVAVAAGEDHALALKSDGSVLAWGGNDGGQLQIPATLVFASAVSASWHFSAAVSSAAPAFFHGINPVWSAGVFRVGVSTETGFFYRLEYKDSLADAPWSPLPTVAGSGGTMTLSDTSANASRRCYRIARW